MPDQLPCGECARMLDAEALVAPPRSGGAVLLCPTCAATAAMPNQPNLPKQAKKAAIDVALRQVSGDEEHISRVGLFALRRNVEEVVAAAAPAIRAAAVEEERKRLKATALHELASMVGRARLAVQQVEPDVVRENLDEAAQAVERFRRHLAGKLDAITELNEGERLDQARADAEEIVDWRCECATLNRGHEAFCYTCGAGKPESREEVEAYILIANGCEDEARAILAVGVEGGEVPDA